MSWIGLLLLAYGTTDLTNSLRPVRLLPVGHGSPPALGATASWRLPAILLPR